MTKMEIEEATKKRASKDATFGFVISLLFASTLILISSWGTSAEGWSICAILS